MGTPPSSEQKEKRTSPSGRLSSSKQPSWTKLEVDPFGEKAVVSTSVRRLYTVVIIVPFRVIRDWGGLASAQLPTPAPPPPAHLVEVAAICGADVGQDSVVVGKHDRSPLSKARDLGKALPVGENVLAVQRLWTPVEGAVGGIGDVGRLVKVDELPVLRVDGKAHRFDDSLGDKDAAHRDVCAGRRVGDVPGCGHNVGAGDKGAAWPGDERGQQCEEQEGGHGEMAKASVRAGQRLRLLSSLRSTRNTISGSGGPTVFQAVFIRHDGGVEESECKRADPSSRVPRQ